MRKFETICQENYARIYNYIYGMTGNAFLAEDLTQEVFLIAYKRGASFLEHEKPEAFLYKTAKNKVLEALRKKREYPMDQVGEVFSVEGDLADVLIKEQDQKIEERKFLQQIMAELTADEQRLYRYYYIEKKSVKLIAAEEQIGETALKMRYVRLRKKVRRAIKDLDMGNLS